MWFGMRNGKACVRRGNTDANSALWLDSQALAAGERSEMKGNNYTLSNMDMVYFVDGLYPHASVNDDGDWQAEDNPVFDAVIETRDPHQTAIAFSSDRSYFPGLMAAMTSVRKFHPQTPLVIIDDGLTISQVSFLRQYAEVVRSSNPLPGIPAWARLDVARLKYDRVVYLDADIILVREIPELLETNAEFAAVKNLDWPIKENFSDPTVLKEYGIDADAPAFNAGVFSIDNCKWGKSRLAQEALKIYHRIGYAFAYADQSALQVLMNLNGSSVTFLDDGYNAIAECWDWQNQGDSVRIVHYAGDEIKPWHPLCKYPMLDLFFAHSKIKRPLFSAAFLQSSQRGEDAK
jgi:lipopolysaccharide biosynthesis glycosyltransferase